MELVDKCGIKIVVKENPNLILRGATDRDLEQLRQWKNRNKKFFFYQQEITEAQQKEWFAAYLDRPFDFMFITEFECLPFGCMGIRWQEKKWDIYNVIRGLQEYGGLGLMRLALHSMIIFAIKLKIAPITVKVLKQNPAIRWYLKHGFVITQVHDDHYLISYSQNLSGRVD